MLSVSEKIADYRRRLCPRTSYESSNEFFVVKNRDPECYKHTSALMLFLKKTNEFSIIRAIAADTFATLDFIERINNQVIFIWQPDERTLKFVNQVVAKQKTKVLVISDTRAAMNVKRILSSFHEVKNKDYNLEQETLDSLVLLILHLNVSSTRRLSDRHSLPPDEASGLWGHPPVVSQQQFRYLWTRATSGAAADGKYRVLQRLSNVPLKRDEKEYKVMQSYFDRLIKDCVEQGREDFHVYNMLRSALRQKTLPMNMEVQNGTAIPREVLVPQAARTGVEAEWDEEGDGRALFMTARTIACIPNKNMKSIKTLLDYGCAEGAITVHLRSELGIEPARCYGADVRNISSEGFTFLLLPKESEAPPRVGEILPQLASGSVDLITAAMVFHHVRHIKETLLELRRVISDHGILVIREHHCESASDAVFLDITHGLFSLVMSDPIEWPSFLSEYRAWYRSRELWNDLLRVCGFERLDQSSSNSDAEKAYNSCISHNHNRPASRGGDYPYIRNVIKAYYAVYKPIPVSLNPSLYIHSSTSRSRADDTTINNEIRKVFESSKYPGMFYTHNPESGDVYWIPSQQRGRTVDSKDRKKLQSSFSTGASSGSSNSNTNINNSNHNGSSSGPIDLSSSRDAEHMIFESQTHPRHFYSLSTDNLRQPQWVNVIIAKHQEST